MVMTLNPVVCRDKKKDFAKPGQVPRLHLHHDREGAQAGRRSATDIAPDVRRHMAKMTIEETMGWTHCPLGEGQTLLVVCHLEPTFAPTYCSPELRLDHIYMLPIDPVVFEWPLAVASASTSATTTPNNTPNKKPKIELRTDF